MRAIKILLVDDNLIIRKSFKELLTTIPYTEIIGECSDGIEVIPFIKEKEPELIFMDIIMKNMDGFETTKQVKEYYSHIKIIAFSSFNHINFINKMKESGADGFVCKFDVNEQLIISEIKKVMN